MLHHVTVSLCLYVGPGLAIRVICQSSPHIREDFSPTNSLLTHIVTFYHACRQSSPITASFEKLISKDERDFLLRLTERCRISATLLPIYSVGVQVRELEAALFNYTLLVHACNCLFCKQGDARSYNYVVALSSPVELEPSWPDRMKLAKIIPRICHNINRLVHAFLHLCRKSSLSTLPSLLPLTSSRVVWVFGGIVDGPIDDVTPTYLTEGVLSTLRQADCIADQVLTRHSEFTSNLLCCH